jgi:glycosyltransferase involved in cell wall biosynthesis
MECLLPGARMTKVGIYLRAKPEMGGTLQYNLSILKAAELLPRDRFEIVVAFSSDYWRNKIQRFDLKKLYLGNAFISRASIVLWHRLHLPVSGWRKLAPFWHPLAREFIKQECDVWVFPSQDSMSYWMPVRSLSAIHDLMHRYESGFSESASFFEYRLRERLYSAMTQWCAGILVDSELGRRQVHDSYGTSMNKLYSLPFVPPDYIYRDVSAEEKNSLRRKYNLPDKFFFYPAQFWKHKNHELLIKGLHIALDVCPDMALVFSGGRKNNYDCVMELIGELGLGDRVHVVGYISDDEMSAMYHCALALLMPTFYGPTNIPPLEAMACGCPIAVSRIYGMPEQLGDAALYFDPRSEDEVSRVMVNLWSDPELCDVMKTKAARKSDAWGNAAFSEKLGQILEEVSLSQVAG